MAKDFTQVAQIFRFPTLCKICLFYFILGQRTCSKTGEDKLDTYADVAAVAAVWPVKKTIYVEEIAIRNKPE